MVDPNAHNVNVFSRILSAIRRGVISFFNLPGNEGGSSKRGSSRGKVRGEARKGNKQKTVLRRRRLNEIAKESRRINWKRAA